jgi:hypothetical protein
MSSRNMSLLPRATLHSDSEQERFSSFGCFSSNKKEPKGEGREGEGGKGNGWEIEGKGKGKVRVRVRERRGG